MSFNLGGYMKESDKSVNGDHRVMSDPTAERKDFIKHIKENAIKGESKEKAVEKDNKKMNQN
jgi:hypothetical protein